MFQNITTCSKNLLSNKKETSSQYMAKNNSCYPQKKTFITFPRHVTFPRFYNVKQLILVAFGNSSFGNKLFLSLYIAVVKVRACAHKKLLMFSAIKLHWFV